MKQLLSLLLQCFLLLSAGVGVLMNDNDKENEEVNVPVKRDYGSPLHLPLVLAGNFGEPRPNHFHGGVDLKTEGVEGRPVFSIGDGYVSHITIGIGGFGNAIYIHHPEGYTSIYCHLKKFSPVVTAQLRKHQYESEHYAGEITFKPSELPVAKGQLIAVSGNTGASTAPHLHLEIHDTETWDMLDPLDFIGSHVADSIPPQAHAFMAYPVEGEGVFCGSSFSRYEYFSSHNLGNRYTAWGRVGFGIWANDYMEDSFNHFGIRHTQLFVDGKEVFHANVGRIPVADNPQVNYWGDYPHYLRSHVWYMKSFLLENQSFCPLQADSLLGVVNFNEPREYLIQYVLTDFKGNSSSYSFVVTASPQPLPTSSSSQPRYSTPQPVDIQLPGMQLSLPRHAIAGRISLNPTAESGLSPLSNTYQLTDKPCPLLRHGSLSIMLKQDVANPEKLFITSSLPNRSYLPVTVKGKWVTADITELNAAYSIAYDDTPPTIRPATTPSAKAIMMNIHDELSGIKSCKAYVDGNFVLLETHEKTTLWSCNLEQTPVRQTGGRHMLKVVATDNCNNQSTYQTQLIY